MGAVRPGVGDDLHLLGNEPAVVVDPGLVGDGLRVPGPARDELFLSGELESNRFPGGHREVAHDVFDQHLLLHAETAADPGFDDADLLHGQAEQRRHHPASVERLLGRGSDHLPLVAVPPRDGDVGLDWSLLDLVDAQRLFEHVIGVLEGSVHVSGVRRDVVNDIA